MHIANNVWFFKDGFTKEQCDQIIKKQKKAKKQKGTTGGNSPPNNLTRDSYISWVNNDKKLYQSMAMYISLANKNAGWNFETSWTEDIQFTQYKKNQHYNWHQDMWDKPYSNHNFSQYNGKIRKLSCSVILNDPDEYEGGDLEIGHTNKYVDGDINTHKFVFNKKNIKQGSVVVFPAFIWHRVTPVKKGIRYSLVSWTLGQPYV